MTLPPLPSRPTPESQRLADEVFEFLKGSGISFAPDGANEFQLFVVRALSEYEDVPDRNVYELANRIKTIAKSDGISIITADIWEKIRERLCPLLYWC